VVPERCERFRESVSLGVDGMLSTFETALLDRHLVRCGPCRAFATAVRAQTTALRSAELDVPAVPVVVAAAARGHVGRRVGGAVAALAVAASAALIVLAPAAERHETPATQATKLLFKVVPERPNAEATFEVPRLKAVSPASADGPVRGYYGLPVAES